MDENDRRAERTHRSPPEVDPQFIKFVMILYFNLYKIWNYLKKIYPADKYKLDLINKKIILEKKFL